MSGAPDAESARRGAKFTWSTRDDKVLVECVLELRALLRDPVRSYPRTKFWKAISDHMVLNHELHRNSRQCRDRFNLLFSRAVARAPTHRDTDLDDLLETCKARFYFGNGRSLEVKDSSLSHSPSRQHSLSTLLDPPDVQTELKYVRDTLDELRAEVARIKIDLQRLYEIVEAR
ncbi:LAMI_0G10550g1_1 [Lachancea mirantina]|uniref:LAMI_0G10550g1_1 n=1 Tax=Lachancea mirantina TaxID=1230905 RepID=A0A1G4KAP5_9SACH|nr:LAMI_0G10550g1_1 [Lachancea mirantina]